MVKINKRDNGTLYAVVDTDCGKYLLDEQNSTDEGRAIYKLIEHAFNIQQALGVYAHESKWMPNDFITCPREVVFLWGADNENKTHGYEIAQEALKG